MLKMYPFYSNKLPSLLKRLFDTSFSSLILTDVIVSQMLCFKFIQCVGIT
jgi:hypothetical protein